jgi:SAM-dependent methyltransferase
LFQFLCFGFRERRYNLIEALTRLESRSSDPQTGFVLDLGGGPASFFAALYPHPERLLLVDVSYDLARQARARTTAHVLVADGEALPFADGSIDTVVCNSVLEHVEHPEAMASEIRRTGRNYFVQTPNGGFPLETHSFVAIPFYNLIPWEGVRQFLCTLLGANYGYVCEVRYVPPTSLGALFPEATIAHERVLGLIKSFYVYHVPIDPQAAGAADECSATTNSERTGTP